jgi:hypothetical protein
MPKPRPAYLPDQFYHFYNRGAHRVSIRVVVRKRFLLGKNNYFSEVNR